MARKVFVAATGQNIGKTTICLSLLHLVQKKYRRVGFIKPLGPKPTVLKGVAMDKDAALMAQVFGLGRDLRHMSPVVLGRGSTKKFLDGSLTTAELEQRLVTACREMEEKYDFLVIEGAGHNPQLEVPDRFSEIVLAFDATLGGPITSAQAAMSSATFASFQSALNGPHGSVHVRTGGQMGSVPRAGFDPIFYFHHCNVDRLWWNWQQSHPGAAMPASEATHPLDPFPRPFENTWLTGEEVGALYREVDL